MIDVLLPLACMIILAFLLLITMRPPGLLAVGFLIWALNMSPLVGQLGTVFPVVAVVFVIAAVAKYQSGGRRPSRQVAFLAFLPLIAGAAGLALSPYAVDRSEAAGFSIAAMLLGVLAVFVAGALPGKLVARSAFGALVVLVLASYALSLALPSQAIVNGRWIGITANANSLGIMAFVFVGVAFAVGDRAVAFAVPLGAGLAVLSGSRGGTSALIAAVAAGVWVGSTSVGRSQSSTWFRRGILVSCLVGLAWAVANAMHAPDAPVDGILRAGESGRAQLLRENWESFLSSPWTANGFGLLVIGEAEGAHTFPVVMAVQLGVFGLVLVGLVVWAWLRSPWRSIPALAALGAGSFVSLLTEAWLFGAGSVSVGIYWLVVASLASESVGSGPPPLPQNGERSEGGQVAGLGAEATSPGRAAPRTPTPLMRKLIQPGRQELSAQPGSVAAQLSGRPVRG